MEAGETLRRCLAIFETTLGQRDVQVSNALYDLSVLAQEAERLDEAEDFSKRCLVIREAKLPQEGGHVALAHHRFIKPSPL